MSARPLSPNQRALLLVLAGGAMLRWRIHRGEWRYLLGDQVVDGRSVAGLQYRGLVFAGAACGLTDEGRRVAETLT